MVIRRTTLIACVAAGLWLGACGSDAAKTSVTDSTVATTTTGVAPTESSTTSTIAGAVTPGSDTTSTSTATAGTTTGSTTATTTAPRVVTSPSDSVKLGDSGDGVTQIQNALKAAGYKVTVDGKFGPQTDTAVRAFQKKNSLGQDGIVGPKTWAKLSGSASTATTAAGSTGATTTSAAGSATTVAATTTTTG